MMNYSSKITKMFAFSIAAALLLLVCAPTFAAPAITVDGQEDDWGINLTTTTVNYSYGKKTTTFDNSSFAPSEDITAYYVEDEFPGYNEPYDYEALYFHYTPDYLFAGVISSHPWNSSENTVRLTVNDTIKTASDASMFAWANLNTDEQYRYTKYPNYFFEVAWSTALFDLSGESNHVILYANCHQSYADKISLCVNIDGTPQEGPAPIPEPATLCLIGIGLAGLASRRVVRRKRK